MPRGDYVASYRPSVFIGGYWVDDAQACEWQVTDPKEPLYGFRDREFRTVAVGQTLVHGILDLLFRYKGYLALALARLNTLSDRIEKGVRSGDVSAQQGPRRLRELLHAATEGNDFASAGIDPLSLTPESRRAFLEKSFQEFDIPTFTRLSEALRDDLWNGAVDTLGLPIVEIQRPRVGSWPFPFDMSVVYDQTDPVALTQNQDNTRVEILRDVHIVGMSKMITNSVPGGARAIIERYQFIARTVE